MSLWHQEVVNLWCEMRVSFDRARTTDAHHRVSIVAKSRP